MTNVQSVVTPVATNGATYVPPTSKASKAKAKAKASTAAAPMTAAQACETAFQYGASMAGLDGTLTLAVKAFKDNETVLADMLVSLNVGYLTRKLGYSVEKATEVVGLLKYNEKKTDDHHRTFEQQRVMDTVRVMWSRVQRMAGVVKAKSDNQIAAEAKRAETEAAKSARESQLIRADEIVNPPAEIDAFDALARLVLTMKSLESKYSAKLVGDRGAAWRDWLAAAPK